MQYFKLSAVVPVLLLSGCSVFENNFDDYAYTKAKVIEPITVPEGLTKPVQKTAYNIPKNVAPGKTGTELEMLTPIQVMPLAFGSRIDEGEKLARIWLDKKEGIDDLNAYIWQQIQRHLKANDIGVKSIEQDKVSLTSDWILNEKEAGFWLWKSIEETKGMRFKYNIDMKPHGRSAAISVELIEYLSESNAQMNDKISGIAKKRAEANALNQFLSYYDLHYRAMVKETVATSDVSTFNVGFDKDGEPAFVSKQSVDSIWSQLESVLEALNFEIQDLNISKKVYYTEYIQPSNGIWDSLWGDNDVEKLSLIEQKYQVRVGESDEGTTISIFDDNGNAVSPAFYVDSHQVFANVVRKLQLEF